LIPRSEIAGSADTQRGRGNTAPLPSVKQLHSLIAEALPAEARLTPLKGFKIDLTANPDFQKIFFAARCDCGTVGLLSVEVSREKSMAEVRRAAPELARRLDLQASTFYGMSCEAHQRMRLGPAAAGKVDRSSSEDTCHAS